VKILFELVAKSLFTNIILYFMFYLLARNRTAYAILGALTMVIDR
jgi:hypothetical protein